MLAVTVGSFHYRLYAGKAKGGLPEHCVVGLTAGPMVAAVCRIPASAALPAAVSALPDSPQSAALDAAVSALPGLCREAAANYEAAKAKRKANQRAARKAHRFAGDPMQLEPNAGLNGQASA